MSLYDTLRSIIKEAVIKKEDGSFNLYTKQASAVGIPDRTDYGDVTSIPLNKKLKFVVQKHYAKRSGPHFDVRLGDTELHSWATRKGLPKPGEKHLFIHQPIHSMDYGEFEGKILHGYGAGRVHTHESGSAIVTKATPDKISFTLLHRKFPEQFSLLKTEDKNWLAINTTPTSPEKFLPNSEAFQKLKMKAVKNPNLDKLVNTHLISAKLSGASNLFKLRRDGVDVVSYRVSKTGRPLIHTLKLMGLDKQKIKIPKDLVGTVLRGEVYGEQGGKAIGEQVLGGLLNSSIEKSLDKQKAENIDLKAAIFDIVGFKGKPMDRVAKIKDILHYLPSNKFVQPEYAEGREKALKLIHQIARGRHNLTNEGVVAWPLAGGEPIKVKNYEETDVYVRGFSEGEGKYKGRGIGAIKYSLTPKGKIVGEVASGLTDETREELYKNPKDYIGRVANIKYRAQTRTGAYFQPSFIAFHESPRSKTAGVIDAMSYKG